MLQQKLWAHYNKQRTLKVRPTREGVREFCSKRQSVCVCGGGGELAFFFPGGAWGGRQNLGGPLDSVHFSIYPKIFPPAAAKNPLKCLGGLGGGDSLPPPPGKKNARGNRDPNPSQEFFCFVSFLRQCWQKLDYLTDFYSILFLPKKGLKITKKCFRFPQTTYNR